jgi:hypothetical protein
MGPTGVTNGHNFNTHYIQKDDALLNRQVERMFKNDFNEPMFDSKVTMSADDRRALDKMENSVRMVDGHYEIALPWKSTTISLPNNRACAERRLVYLKKRLQIRETHTYLKAIEPL